jgi:hypothetical protein
MKYIKAVFHDHGKLVKKRKQLKKLPTIKQKLKLKQKKKY